MKHLSHRAPRGAARLLTILLAAALGAVPAAHAAAPKVEKVKFHKTSDAAEFRVQLSGAPSAAPSVRQVGVYVAFVLPGVSSEEAREEIEAEDALFEKAVLLRQDEALLVAVRTKERELLTRARIEGEGKSWKLRLFRSAEAVKQSDAARDLERSLDGAEAAAKAEDARARATDKGADKAAAGAAKEPAKKLAAGAVAAVTAPASPVATTPAAAAPTAAEAPRVGIKSSAPVLAGQPSPGLSTSTRAVAAVGFLAIAALVGLWLARRNKLQGGGRSPIRILSAQPAPGGKRHILLVEVHGERLLLGAAEGGITLLARVDTPEQEGLDLAIDEDAQLRVSGGRASPAGGGQGGLLGKLRTAFGGRQAPASDGPRASSPAGREPSPALNPRERVEVASEEPVASRAAGQSPAWTVALSEAMSSRAGSAGADAAASSTADLIRRKLAELNRA